MKTTNQTKTKTELTHQFLRLMVLGSLLANEKHQAAAYTQANHAIAHAADQLSAVLQNQAADPFLYTIICETELTSFSAYRAIADIHNLIDHFATHSFVHQLSTALTPEEHAALQEGALVLCQRTYSHSSNNSCCQVEESQSTAKMTLRPSLAFFIEQATRHNPAFLSEMRGNAPRNQLLADVFVELSQLADKPLAQTRLITRVNAVPQHESSTQSTFQAPSAPPEVLAAVFEVVQQFYRSDRSLGQVLKLSRKLNRIWLKAYRKERGVGNAAR